MVNQTTAWNLHGQIRFKICFCQSDNSSFSSFIKKTILQNNDYKSIIILSKEGLDADFLEVLRQGIDANIIYSSRLFPKSIASKFFPLNASDNNYNDGVTISDSQKLECKRFWVQILISLKLKCNLAGVISGNFGYFAERELANAATQIGLPFIVMHKENLKSIGRVKFYEEVYIARGKFGGHGITVYNDVERKLQIRSGVATENKFSTAECHV